MQDDVRDLILSSIETALAAQLQAVRKLRRQTDAPLQPRLRKGTSQVDMAYDILRASRSPLHIAEIISRIQSAYGAGVDRESLVSSLTKKVARGDRFVRTGRNTFGLKENS